MKALKIKYKNLFVKKEFLLTLGLSLVVFVISLVINFYAGTYATERASNSVTDIILNNIRTFDVDSIFIYGSFVLAVFIASILILRPEKMPFILKSVALFVIIRSLFITLTHLGPFPSQVVIQSDILKNFSFGGDLFFSGHTGLPFLMSLMFWDNKYLRYIFLVFSIIFAIVVLLGHMHYSIDVLSAFFITYTIFHICLFLFKKDWKMFHYGL